MAWVQHVTCRDLQGVVLDACHRATRSHLMTPVVPALPRRVLLECGSDTAAAQLRINAERLDEAFPERRAVVHDRRPAFLGADHLNQVAQEADVPGAVKGGEHVRFFRGRKARGEVTVLGQHAGRQAEHLLKPWCPGLNLSYLHEQLRLGLVHPSIMPPCRGNGPASRSCYSAGQVSARTCWMLMISWPSYGETVYQMVTLSDGRWSS
jgi:hypothetical protein